MRNLLFAILAVVFAIPMYGASDSTIRMDYSNPGLNPSKWTLEFHPDGTGHFHAEGANKPIYEGDELVPSQVDRDVSLKSNFAGQVFQTVHQQKLLKVQCESHLKVAFQGWKKITYSGPDGEGSCEFNYSKNSNIQTLGDSLVAVAATLIEGARLELLLQHDPLGLDKAIQFIVEGSADGRLQQVCAIRGILQRLEDDPHVMERVRKRARTLLAQAEN